MKKPRQFLPVLKQMLGFYRFGPIPLLIYLVITTAVLLVSSGFLPMGWMESHTRPQYWSEQLFLGCCVWWCLLMLIATPVPFQLLGGTMSLEFLFTRAVHRGLWLRTERIAVIIIGLGPLILNLVLSPLGPELAFQLADYGSPAALVQQRYLQLFPGSHLTTVNSVGSPAQLVIRHGTETFSAWLIWFGLLSIFLVAAYFSLVFTAWQRYGWHHSESRWRPWLGALITNAPAFLPVPSLLLCTGLHLNIFEESFLLFARHPLPHSLVLIVFILLVQPFTERNINQFEFEFS